MGPKKSPARKKQAPKKHAQRKQYSVEEKAKLMKRVTSQAATKADIVHKTGMSWSTFSTMFKNHEKIIAAADSIAPGVKRVNNKQRAPLADQMEKLLVTWIEVKNERREPVSQAMVQEKARRIYKDLVDEGAREKAAAAENANAARSAAAKDANANSTEEDPNEEAGDDDEAADVDEEGDNEDPPPEFAGELNNEFFLSDKIRFCFNLRL
jgi:hypothetical protein